MSINNRVGSNVDAIRILRRQNMPNVVNQRENIPLDRDEYDPILPDDTAATNDTLFGLVSLDARRLPLRQIIDHIINQPVGSRTTLPLEGYTIGQLVWAMMEEGMDIRGLYLSGEMVRLEPMSVDNEMVHLHGGQNYDIDAANNPFGYSVEKMQIFEFPLSKIMLAPQLIDLSLTNMNWEELASLDIFDYIEALRYTEAGSNMSFLVMWDGCHIKKRFGPSERIIPALTFAAQTGGFPQLLTKSYLLEAEYPNCPLFNPDKFGDVLRKKSRGVQPFSFRIFIPSGDSNCVEASIRHLYHHNEAHVFPSAPFVGDTLQFLPILNSSDEGDVEDAAADEKMEEEKEADEVILPDSPLLSQHLQQRNSTQTNRTLADIDQMLIDSLLASFQEKIVNDKMKTKKFKNLKCTMTEKREKAIRHYKKLIRGGYSNNFLRKLIQHFRNESNIILHIFYLFYDASHNQPFRLRDRGEAFTDPKKDLDTSSTAIHLFLFQMRLDGSIFSNRDGVQVSGKDPTSGDGDKQFIGFLHMIGVYTSSPQDFYNCLLPLIVRKNSKSFFLPAVNFVNYMVEKYLEPHMKIVHQKMAYDHETDFESIQEHVEYQIARQQKGVVPTLIFSNNNQHSTHNSNTSIYVDDPSLPSNIRAQRYNENLKRGYYAVVAYDLETVELTIDVIDQIRPAFKQNNATAEDLIAGGYQPVESVVPFSAQWAPVNTQHEGKILQLSQQAGLRIVRLKPHDALRNLSVKSGPNENDPLIPYSDIVLRKVETCYGNDRLGECVEEMLLSMACWAFNQGCGYIVAYAHNGSGFDAYVVLRYCTFEIVRILKTSRGILILDYKVPVPGKHPHGKPNEQAYVTVRLRDTRVWLNGNLKRIAQSFKCPPDWQKIDFPITLINHTNCFRPEIKALSIHYGVNDVLALAWIIKKLNWVIGESDWNPASIYSVKPPIAQFVTVMGMVKTSTYFHFLEYYRARSQIVERSLPCALDVPILRNWLKKATMGGRVEAYARSFISPFFGPILNAWKQNNVEELMILYQDMVHQDACDVVLDVTSLYPTAQALCPMPTGKLFSVLSESHANSLIDSIGCEQCEFNMALCPLHRNDTRENNGGFRPFAIILVKNLIYKHQTPPNSAYELFPFCARKLEKNLGLVYSFETNEEIRHRYGDKQDIIHDIQSFSNVDLYWMRKLGWSFDCVGGFGWDTSDIYMSFILNGFDIRKKAKAEGNVVMSEFCKLQINGSYGVTAQGDIEDNNILVSLPEHLIHLNPSDPQVTHFLHTKRRQQLDHSEYVKDGLLLPNGQTFLVKSKVSGIAEYFSALSPMQIGAAVLAWSRHIVNLIIFPHFMRPMKYTDTDSINLPNRIVNWLKKEKPHIVDDSKTAALGTLKNDHVESCGDGARVFFGIFATKKVKLYMVLNQHGKISICTTFKGMNPKMLNNHGNRFHIDRYEHILSKTLFELFFHGSASPKEVTSWKRRMDSGVTINDHIQKFASETYLGRSAGCLFEEREHNGVTEMFVPFGAKKPLHFAFYNASHNPKKPEMKIANNSARLRKLKEYMGGYDETAIYEFLGEFYKHKDTLQNMDNPEFKTICDTILNLPILPPPTPPPPPPPTLHYETTEFIQLDEPIHPCDPSEESTSDLDGELLLDLSDGSCGIPEDLSFN